MKSPDFWTSHYVISTDPAEVAGAVGQLPFTSGADSFELVCFLRDGAAPNILISQGSGGHAYVFAEFAYHLHRTGYNVFVMPRQGGHIVDELLVRHRDALRYIAGEFTGPVGVFSEGLGGYVAFYLALAHAPIGSLVCQNSPAIPTRVGARGARGPAHAQPRSPG